MEFLILTAWGLINIFGFIYVGRKSRKPVPKAIEPEKSDEHRLVRTWIEREDWNMNGWRWKCSCGVIGLSSGIKEATMNEAGSLGAEVLAIDRFKIHANGYREANGNVWKDKHEELQKKFDESQEKCYCKDISPVQLIALRD